LKEYSNLDFLRALAVTVVTGAHVAEFYVNALKIIRPLGAVGVNLFFVHTALVLMQSLERQERDGSRHLFWDFAIRRFFRIYPLATFVTLAVILFHIPSNRMEVGHLYSMKLSVGSIISNLTLTQGFFALVLTIVAPMWSLSFEVYMYLFLPALYRLLRYNFAILFAGSLAVSTLLLYYYPYETGWSYLRIFQYVPCFMPGIMAYWLSKKVTPRFPAYSWVIFLFAVLGITYSDIAPNWRFFPGWGRWWVPIVVGFSIPFFKQLTSPTLTKASKIIARYSYGIYLVHYFCIWAALEKIGHNHLVLGIMSFCLLLVAIPVVLYHVLEEPLINFGKRIIQRRFRQPEISTVFLGSESRPLKNSTL